MDKAALLRAVDFALAGKWDDAHRIVQEYEDDFACLSGRQACRIHAVLHKMEGDESNSRYWYRRAGKEFDPNTTPDDELILIKNELRS